MPPAADLLWAMGDKSVPNDGFTQQRVFPLVSCKVKDCFVSFISQEHTVRGRRDGATLCRRPGMGLCLVLLVCYKQNVILSLLVLQEQQAQADLAATSDSSLPPASSADVEARSEQLQDLSLAATSSDSAADTAAAAANGESDTGDAATPSAAGAAAAGQPASMDALLEAAVLAGLRQTTNAELPMQTGDFYTKKMLAFKPEGAHSSSAPHALPERCKGWCSRRSCMPIRCMSSDGN